MSEQRQGPAQGNNTHTSGFPSNFQPLIFETFSGLNTKTPRPGIRDSECAWIDGFMIVGPNNVRTLYGTGPDIFIDTAKRGIVWFGFGNVDVVLYCYVLLGDGSLYQVRPAVGTTTQVMPPGTINPANSVFGFSQFGSRYIIFSNDQPNGYWLWDGTTLFTAGTLAPMVPVVAEGQGYTSTPTMNIVTTGNGTGGDFNFQIQNGKIAQVTCTNPGMDYGVDDFTAAYLTGGGSDSSAVLSCVVSSNTGGLAEVYVINAGSGYTGYAYATVYGDGSDASVSLSIQNGSLTGIAIVTAGKGYTWVVIQVYDPGIPDVAPGGHGGSVGGTLTFGQITGISVISGGSGYVSPPTVTIQGDGVNATAIAEISGGVVTMLVMTNLGQGYTKAVALLSGGNMGGAVTLQTMPFGVSGTTVEMYENYVWDANGAAVADFPPKNRVIFSAPNSPQDFGDGGGAFQSTDSFLRVGVHCLKQSNGFLYLIADSSINYISNVQTTSSGSGSVPAIPTTTFGNLNVDPQIGTPWPSSVQVFQRNIVFGNTIGVYASYGGAVKKVSEPLDGFYSTGPIYGATSNYSSAVAEIFGIPVYMILLPVIDPFSGLQSNKLLMWDGTRWFVSSQDRRLTYIATQELNSVLTAYGTDGTAIFPLFAQPSTGFTKTLQSKLFSNPGYFTTKIARSLSGVFNSYVVDDGLTITIDSELGLGTANALQIVPAGGATGITWVNVSNAPVSWINESSEAVSWNGSAGNNGVTVFGPYPVGQQGRLIGLTLQTRASDLAIVSLMVSEPVWTPNV